MKKALFSAGLIAGAAMSCNVQAQTPGCDDVVWDQAILDRMPNAPEYCLGVFRQGDEFYAQLHAQIIEQRGQNTVVRYREQSGRWGGREHVHPPRGFTASIDGEDVMIRNLRPRQEVDIHVIGEGNFTVPSYTVAEVAESTPEPIADPTPPPRAEPAPTMLPRTAGNANWLLVLGGLMLALGAALRITRS